MYNGPVYLAKISLMEDTELRDAYCDTLKSMCHFEIKDNNLIIKIDFEGPGFAEWDYLKLTDKNYRETMKMLSEEGKTISEWVSENFRVKYVEKPKHDCHTSDDPDCAGCTL
jgi:hypothetical protein